MLMVEKVVCMWDSLLCTQFKISPKKQQAIWTTTNPTSRSWKKNTYYLVNREIKWRKQKTRYWELNNNKTLLHQNLTEIEYLLVAPTQKKKDNDGYYDL